ncbi:MAG: Rrf2 family transcriptional regulator [Elusimicrobia bacterium]|nr:Rrf2 family transcriptional regulator [Elusimicrobiota bacterium]
MRLSQAAEHALRAALFLASRPRRNARLPEIARAQGIPPASLSRALRCLAGRGIILSAAGYQGGYRMLKDPAQVSLRQVIEAAEGPIFYSHCPFHGNVCDRESRHWCPVHDVWEAAKRDFLEALESQTLQDLVGRMARWSTVERLLEEVARNPAAR